MKFAKFLRRFIAKSHDGFQNQTLAVAPEVSASVHADGVALLHIPTGKVYLCNRTASRIWDGVVKGFTAEAICNELSRECGVGREVVEQHTFSFLSELERRRLVIRRVDA